MSKPKIYFADLTHTAHGISVATFPLGISYVLSYAKKHLGASPFDCLTYVKEHPEDYSPRIQEIIAAFLGQTTKDLYDSFEEAQNNENNH